MTVNSEAPRGNFRQRLGGDMLLHVAPTGDDANTGVSADKALRTLNEFYRRVRSDYDLAGHRLAAQLADGEYHEDDVSCVAATVGATQVYVQGREGDPGAVKLRCGGGHNLFYTRDFGRTTLRNLTLGSVGTNSRLINVSTFSTLDLDQVWFDEAAEGIHIYVCQGSLMVQNNYRINGAASRHLSAADNGVVHYGSYTVDIPQPLRFDDFVVAESGALITAGGAPMKFQGGGLRGCSGRRYVVVPPGRLFSNNTRFPGDQIGIIARATTDACWYN
jgi:hypothetical protein